MQRIYLDHASATPLLPGVQEAMTPWLSHAADPARVHSAGREARVAVESARETVGFHLGLEPRNVIFTSSGTESLNWVVYAACGLTPKSPGPWGRHIVVSCVEHSAVLDAARAATGRAGLELVEVPVDTSGTIEDFTIPADTALVAVQHVNHETGVIQPIDAIRTRCREASTKLLMDACQSVGLPIPEADFVAISGHKRGAPSGTGALGVARRVRLDPLFVGGEQELLRRAGGENVAGAVGLATAMAAPREDLSPLRDRLVATLDAVDGVVVLSRDRPRAPHIVCATVPGLSGEALLIGLDRAGIAANSGSSCSAEQLEPSHVLLAMGADADASLRFSFGQENKPADVDAVATVLPGIIQDLKEYTRRGEPEIYS